MGQSGSPWATVAVCSLLCALPASCDWTDKGGIDTQSVQDTNAVLSSRHLPVLPAGVMTIRCWTGGVFAKYMNVKFSASPDQTLDYLGRANAEFYFEFEMNEGNYRVVAKHSLGTAPDYPDRPRLSGSEVKPVGLGSHPWFKGVYEIRHGWYYHFQDGPMHYDFYYDVDNHEFYVHWQYS